MEVLLSHGGKIPRAQSGPLSTLESEDNTQEDFLVSGFWFLVEMEGCSRAMAMACWHKEPERDTNVEPREENPKASQESLINIFCGAPAPAMSTLSFPEATGDETRLD